MQQRDFYSGVDIYLGQIIAHDQMLTNGVLCLLL